MTVYSCATDSFSTLVGVVLVCPCRTNLAHPSWGDDFRMQTGFDPRPLSLESFTELISSNSRLRDAFGYHWTDAELRGLHRYMNFMTLARGQLLFRKGRWYEHVCLILQGNVSAHLDGRSSPSVGCKRSGEWVGGATFMMGLLRPEAALHPCDVFATEYCEVCHHVYIIPVAP